MIDSYLSTHRGRLPIVYAVVDLTCLEKTGKYKDLAGLVRTYNGKRGVHVALLYLSHWSVSPALELPGSIVVKSTATPTDLALSLLRQIPSEWCARFKIRVLTDAGFSTTETDPQRPETRL